MTASRGAAPDEGGAIDNEAFYDHHWEHVDTSQDPAVVEKGDRILEMLPRDTLTIADVGCGDGYLTGRLAGRFEVTAVDRSATALARLKTRGITGISASADALPLTDGAVDLVFSSEVLEHLPDDILARAAREFDRVARRYLFLSVPYRENLQRRVVRCPRCRLEFHIDGHLHSLDGEALDRLFPRFRRIATALAGPHEPSTYARLERLRQRAARHWFLWDGLKLTCPSCGEDRFAKLPRNGLHRLLDHAINTTTSALNTVTRRKGAPYWILALYARREDR